MPATAVRSVASRTWIPLPFLLGVLVGVLGTLGWWIWRRDYVVPIKSMIGVTRSAPTDPAASKAQEAVRRHLASSLEDRAAIQFLEWSGPEPVPKEESMVITGFQQVTHLASRATATYRLKPGEDTYRHVFCFGDDGLVVSQYDAPLDEPAKAKATP